MLSLISIILGFTIGLTTFTMFVPDWVERYKDRKIPKIPMSATDTKLLQEESLKQKVRLLLPVVLKDISREINSEAKKCHNTAYFTFVYECNIPELIHTVMEQLVGMGYAVSEDEEDDETYITIRWD